jgi:hypothetical protein
MTNIEKKDFQASGTRLSFITYKEIEGFKEDEILCGVDADFIENICQEFLKP